MRAGRSLRTRKRSVARNSQSRRGCGGDRPVTQLRDGERAAQVGAPIRAERVAARLQHHRDRLTNALRATRRPTRRRLDRAIEQRHPIPEGLHGPIPPRSECPPVGDRPKARFGRRRVQPSTARQARSRSRSSVPRSASPSQSLPTPESSPSKGWPAVNHSTQLLWVDSRGTDSCDPLETVCGTSDHSRSSNALTAAPVEMSGMARIGDAATQLAKHWPRRTNASRRWRSVWLYD